MNQPEILILTTGPAHFPLVEDHGFGQPWMVDFHGHVAPAGASAHMKLLKVRFDEAIHLLNEAQVEALLNDDRTSAMTKAALAK